MKYMNVVPDDVRRFAAVLLNWRISFDDIFFLGYVRKKWIALKMLQIYTYMINIYAVIATSQRNEYFKFVDCKRIMLKIEVENCISYRNIPSSLTPGIPTEFHYP